MKAYALAALLVAGFSTSATAGESTIAQLAADSGLREREVKMVLGAHSSYAEYRTSYARAKRQLVRTIGQQQVDKLAADMRAGRLEDKT